MNQDKSGKAQVLHAMIDSNASTFDEQLFKKVLSADEFFIRDHIVNGHIWLPGTGYLEMARAASELAANRAVTQIKDVAWLKPINLEQHASIEIGISLVPSADNNAHIKIFSQTESAERTIYCEGDVSYAADSS